jgi:hypothetical protein
MNFQSDRSASSEIRSESFSAAVGGGGGRGPKCVCHKSLPRIKKGKNKKMFVIIPQKCYIVVHINNMFPFFFYIATREKYAQTKPKRNG